MKIKIDINNRSNRASLDRLFDELRRLIQANPTISTFAEFIRDENCVLTSDTWVFSRSSPDCRIETEGLLAEIMTALGVRSAATLSNSLKDSIYYLHSRISRGMNITLARRKMFFTIDKIIRAISNGVHPQK